MDVRASGKGSVWKLCIGLAVVCGVLVFAAGFLHRNSVASAIDAQQAKSAAYVHGKLTEAVGNDRLTKQLSDRETASLEKDAGVPAGTVVSIYALNGDPVFSSGRAVDGDRAAISSAVDGDVSRVISGPDLVVYAPIENKGKVVAVATVSSDVEAVRADAGGPLDVLRLPVVALGVVALIAGLVLMVRGRSTPAAPVASVSTDAVPARQKEKKADAPVKGRVSGFDPAPSLAPAAAQPESDPEEQASVEAAPTQAGASVAVAEPEEPSRSRLSLRLGRKDPKPAAPQAVADKSASQPKAKKSLLGRAGTVEEPAVAAPEAMSAEREASILRLLEDQLEQLRTKIQVQEEAAATANRGLQAQLDEATRRADAAEAQAGGPEGPASIGPAERDMIERLRGLETELVEAKSVAAEAVARADELQRAVDAAPQAGPSAQNPASDELLELRAQVTGAEQRADEAQRLAAEAEQRAASNESVRGELEVRVAQLGAKAGELEQKATELETRLQEANAGGDAVRAEIATLTASLAASNARVEELEASATSVPSPEELEANAAEISRLRTELANQMERAQSAEDRVSTLEADVLAAEHGVVALAEDVSGDTPQDADEVTRQMEPTPAPTIWVAPSARAPAPSEPAAEDEPEVAASSSPTMWVAPAASSEPEPEAEPEPEPELEPEASTPGAQEASAVETGDGFSAVFAAAFVHEDDVSTSRVDASGPDEAAPKQEPTSEMSLPTASVPQTPAVDRYGDVWSAPEPETIERSDTADPGLGEEPAAQLTPAVASSLDDEPATEVDSSMSVDDDLCALRARLAHAADDQGQDTASDGPSWS